MLQSNKLQQTDSNIVRKSLNLSCLKRFNRCLKARKHNYTQTPITQRNYNPRFVKFHYCDKPSKYLLVLKTSWRRLEGVLKTCLEDVLNTCLEDVLNTCLEGMSWRHHGDKQSTYWRYLCIANLNVYLRNLYFTNLYLAILRRIQNALFRSQ